MTPLAAVPALRMLTPAALSVLTERSREARIAADTVVRRPGEIPHSVLFLLSGTVVATYCSPAGAETWPARWHGPAIADKAAVLGGDPPLTGLRTLTEVSVRLLPAAQFARLLEEEPSVREHVLAHLARDAMTRRRRTVEVATRPAVARLAGWLSEQDRSAPVVWRGSQDQLARLLGLSRVTVNRALARLSGAGAVERTPQGIVVADRARLETFAAE